jgi:hypothetical protein
MKRNYRILDYGLLLVIILIVGYAIVATLTMKFSSRDYAYSMPPDPDSSFLEKLSGTLPYQEYTGLVDSFRRDQQRQQYINEGRLAGSSIGGMLGFTKIRGCDTCKGGQPADRSGSMFDSYPLHYYLSLEKYAFRRDTILRLAGYPFYVRKQGKDYLKYLDPGKPRNNGSHPFYDSIRIKMKTIPFRYDKGNQAILVPVSATIYTAGMATRYLLSFLLLVAFLYMGNCFLKFCIDIARGDFFIEENSFRLNVIAYGIIIYSLLDLLTPYLLRLLFAGYITDDVVMVHKSFGEMGFGSMLAGAFFWLLAKAFDRGMRLQEEQELTV